MEIRVLPDAASASVEAARFIAHEARAAVTARGWFTIAFSGGRGPLQMLQALAREPFPWEGTYVAQVDERVAPAGDPDRNLTHLREWLLEKVPIPPEHVFPMPVELPDGAAPYAQTIRQVAGTPPVFDLIHLGLGSDGHTASLVPGDPVLEVGDADVAMTRPYQGRPRMTLTYPVLNAARRVLWLVLDAGKAEVLVQLRDGDTSIPAGRVCPGRALVIADRAAASRL